MSAHLLTSEQTGPIKSGDSRVYACTECTYEAALTRWSRSSYEWHPDTGDSYRTQAAAEHAGHLHHQQSVQPSTITVVQNLLPPAMLTPTAIANLIYRLTISEIPAAACQITGTAGADGKTERELIEAQILRDIGRALLERGNYLAGRTAAGGRYSQAEIAQRLGVSRQAVHQLLNRYATGTYKP